MRPKTLVEEPANFMHPAGLSFHPLSDPKDLPGKASVVSKQSVLTADTTDAESCVFDEAAKGYLRRSRVFRNVMGYLSPRKLVFLQMPTKGIVKRRKPAKRNAIKERLMLMGKWRKWRKKFFREYMSIPLTKISRELALIKAKVYCTK